MSKEIISRGNPLEVEHVGRESGGARLMALRVDDETGDVEVHGVKANGAAAVRVAKKVILAAAVKTLNATAVELIGKPAAGKWIELVSCHVMLKYNGQAYDAVGAGDVLELRYTDGSGALLNNTVSPAGFADATADAHDLLGPAASGVAPANASVVAHLASGEWYSAAGTGDLHFEILYRLRDLAI